MVEAGSPPSGSTSSAPGIGSTASKTALPSNPSNNPDGSQLPSSNLLSQLPPHIQHQLAGMTKDRFQQIITVRKFFLPSSEFSNLKTMAKTSKQVLSMLLLPKLSKHSNICSSCAYIRSMLLVNLRHHLPMRRLHIKRLHRQHQVVRPAQVHQLSLSTQLRL